MKKVIISILLATIFLTMACVGTIENNKPDNDQPNIHSITFFLYEEFDATSNGNKPPLDDTEDDYELMSFKWASSMTYEINIIGCNWRGDIEGVITSSLETWDDATSFELFNTPILTTGISLVGDNINTISWNLLSEGIIAQNSLIFDIDNAEIMESDVTFNSYYIWGDATESPDVMDLHNIATHEFGHNGLLDLKPGRDRALTMYWRSGLGETIKRDLGTGDILGIQALYGSS